MTFGRYDHNHLNNTFHCCRSLHRLCILRHKFLPYLFQPRDSFLHALLQYNLTAIINVTISYYTNKNNGSCTQVLYCEKPFIITKITGCRYIILPLLISARWHVCPHPLEQHLSSRWQSWSPWHSSTQMPPKPSRRTGHSPSWYSRWYIK